MWKAVWRYLLTGEVPETPRAPEPVLSFTGKTEKLGAYRADLCYCGGCYAVLPLHTIGTTVRCVQCKGVNQ